jgi:glyoxylase-like metal-dependent hydrolase (beta-lactamase superfamily II)
MPSQVEPTTIRWHEFELNGPAYHEFERSYDLYGDGAVVLVSMEGHTPGPIGMFVTTESGRRFLFCGDTVWSAAAIPNARPKTLLARAFADDDPAQTLRQIRPLRCRPGFAAHYRPRA